MGYFEVEQSIISLFIDSAKTFTELSTGALVLSIIFYEKVLGVKGRIKFDFAIMASWILFLIAIVTSVFYQYTAIKFLKLQSGFAGSATKIPEALIYNPGIMYAVMMIAFSLGATMFTIGAARRLFLNRTKNE